MRYLKTTTLASRASRDCLWWPLLIFIAFTLVSPALSRNAQAVTPPPDGGEVDSTTENGPITESIRHYLYVAVAGGNIKVYDLDRQHALVKTLRPFIADEEIRGICASAVTHRLYVSYRTGHVCCIDLLTDKVIFNKFYSPDVDRLDCTPDGRKIYLPIGENKNTNFNYVLDADGNILKKVTLSPRTHDALCGLLGNYAYLETVTSRYVYAVDTITDQIRATVGPFGHHVRPFTVNAGETLLFACVEHLFGFEVADMRTGRVLYRVPISGFNYNRSLLVPSHGIGLTGNGRELWVCDATNPYVHVFDSSVMPPVQKRSVRVSYANTHWITFDIAGRFAYISGPHGTSQPMDVIDTATKLKVATIQASRNIIEVDFLNGAVTAVGSQWGVGR